MQIKSFYKANKSIVVNVLTVIVFVILLIPAYFGYVYFSEYGENVKAKLNVQRNEVETLKARKTQKINLENQKKMELESFEESKTEILEQYESLNLKPQDEIVEETNEFIEDITYGIDDVNIRFQEELVNGEVISKIPYHIEMKSNYTEMLDTIKTISNMDQIQIENLRVVLEDNMIKSTVGFYTIAERGTSTENLASSEDENENSESENLGENEIFDINKVIARTNPFGKATTYEEYKERIEQTLDDIKNENSGDPSGYIGNGVVYQPLMVDAELTGDYKKERNLVNDSYTKQSHNVSLKVPEGTNVHAVDFGKVVYVGKLGTHGNTIMIEHSDNIITSYGNVKNIKVVKGQKVSKGRVIAETAGVGNEREPHLKFAIAVDNEFVDPKYFLDIQLEEINDENVETENKENEETEELEDVEGDI